MTSIGQKKKAKRIAVLSILGVLFVACLCFVFGFAISEGWEAVGRWFTSKWATLTVVFVVIFTLAMLTVYFNLKDKEDFK